jgi:hypothetical protein
METGREFRPAEKYRRRKKGVENLLPILSP